ncbi:uncharacterized protein LOC110988663 [Acanthaster planci]|uniref:Uncharacterized protein LOC110988663 n=1 Tax=Acanthaster planci TaxID=133434 RepID=A0A8B7ZSR3_ACAPL|nr:uncharacterized protein LOC110988663 [Acanthaster planci]XP_022108099.1 uncharacterized protein LOC110988663 [Acanthaster planci]
MAMYGLLGAILAVLIGMAWAQHCSERPGGCCPGRNDACTAPGTSCFCDDYCQQASDCCSDFPSGCTNPTTSSATTTAQPTTSSPPTTALPTTASGICGSTVQSLACQVQSDSRITLLNVNPSGVNDGADAKSNIKDTCDGGEARRSSYCCTLSGGKTGCSPGGSICLSEDVLQYLLELANSGASFQVNSIAGACHSNTSYHYQGTAVDLQVFDESSHVAWMNRCASMGAVENKGPGDRGHSTHTHCAF